MPHLMAKGAKGAKGAKARLMDKSPPKILCLILKCLPTEKIAISPALSVDRPEEAYQPVARVVLGRAASTSSELGLMPTLLPS